MSTTSIRTTATRSRRTGRGLLSACAVLVAVGVGAGPAAAAPEEGVPTVPAECPGPVQWGWPNGEGQAYPGQRFGVFLAPQCRGPVLEGLDP
jgi:hypothetical protein